MPQPSNWEPPYPAFSAEFKLPADHAVIAYYGVEWRTGDSTKDSESFHSWMAGMLELPSRPDVINRARCSTGNLITEVFFLYWLDPLRFTQWECSAQHTCWWNDPHRIQEAAGYWRETWRSPLSRTETLLSSQRRFGLSEGAERIRGPIREHAYWGAARDRIPGSAQDLMASTVNTLRRLDPLPKSKGARLRVTPPANVCLIRSGQDWSQCGPKERDLYLSDIHPLLLEAMNFLRTNGSEVGCVFCRFFEELNLHGAEQPRTSAAALFLSLEHLEAWVSQHPTHLAIFRAAGEMAQKLNFKLDLNLWHEVAVLPERMAVGEYLNCEPTTGLLPFFPAESF